MEKSESKSWIDKADESLESAQNSMLKANAWVLKKFIPRIIVGAVILGAWYLTLLGVGFEATLILQLSAIMVILGWDRGRA